MREEKMFLFTSLWKAISGMSDVFILIHLSCQKVETVLLSTLPSISSPKLPRQTEVGAHKRNWKVLLIVLIVFKTTIIYSSFKKDVILTQTVREAGQEDSILSVTNQPLTDEVLYGALEGLGSQAVIKLVART